MNDSVPTAEAGAEASTEVVASPDAVVDHSNDNVPVINTDSSDKPTIPNETTDEQQPATEESNNDSLVVANECDDANDSTAVDAYPTDHPNDNDEDAIDNSQVTDGTKNEHQPEIQDDTANTDPMDTSPSVNQSTDIPSESATSTENNVAVISTRQSPGTRFSTFK